MGIRGELFSTKVILQNRTYFFNVKENRLGDLYLNIVESKNRDEGGFERQSVILFAEDLSEFLGGFDESLRVLERAVREKRRAVPKRREAPPPDETKGPRHGTEQEAQRKKYRARGEKPKDGYRRGGPPGFSKAAGPGGGFRGGRPSPGGQRDGAKGKDETAHRFKARPPKRRVVVKKD